MTAARLRSVVRALAPPLLADAVRRRRGSLYGALPEWRYEPNGWPATTDELGWAHPEIARVGRRRWPDFQRSIESPHPLGRSNESDDPGYAGYATQNTYLAFAYVVARALGRGSSLSVLDWGGGLGHYLLLAEALFPDAAITYTCKDQPTMTSVGEDLLPRATFTDDGTAALADRYGLVMASGSLQYEERWAVTLAALAAAATPWLYVTRLPVVHTASDYVMTQRAHAHGYPTEYAGWVVNRSSLLAVAAASALSLEREFLIQERPPVPGAPEQPEYRGFLFRRNDT